MKNNVKTLILSVFFTLLCVYFAFFSFSGGSYLANAKKQNELTSAKAMVVLEKNSGRVLYSKNHEEKLQMASTTKIITAIFVIENEPDLDRIIEIEKESTGIEGTKIGLKEHEHLTIRELLYGLMLRSGNDAAVALARATCGSEEAFVEKVNSFLHERGFDCTHLANPHGLPAKEHYTTAHDLALITAYALKNPVFSEIVSTKKYQISNELKSAYNRNLENKNKMLKNFEYADGVKTGYTRAAGRCFVGSATKDGMQVVCVLLNCVPMFEECEQLLKKAFEDYKLYKLAGAGDKLKTISIENSNEKQIEVINDKDFSYPLRRDELKQVKVDIAAPEVLRAPISQGCELATLKISLENQLIFSHKIYSIIDIEANDFGTKFNKIIEKM